MSTKHLNQSELARRWCLSERTLSAWRQRGLGPHFIKLNNHVLYREEDVERYEHQCLRKSTSLRAAEEQGT